jgi:hypothetical protein
MEGPTWPRCQWEESRAFPSALERLPTLGLAVGLLLRGQLLLNSVDLFSCLVFWPPGYGAFCRTARDGSMSCALPDSLAGLNCRVFASAPHPEPPSPCASWLAVRVRAVFASPCRMLLPLPVSGPPGPSPAHRPLRIVGGGHWAETVPSEPGR